MVREVVEKIKKFVKMIIHPSGFVEKERAEQVLEHAKQVLELYEKALMREKAKDEEAKEKDAIIRELIDISNINREVAKNIAESEAKLNEHFISMSDMFDELYSTVKECITKKNYKSLKDWVKEFEKIELSDEEWEEILGEVE